ncbi:hypothetical protein FHX78_113494 [Streptomyces capillispiralis]|uniref:Uncharacterized protein n=1 Tax=Streptomyces capillispiralis TaxID=68182 RepID=A0A561THD6_9ACTN|nr:hypothetical protein FHX78_113494 [Streptomyces capillispiralis]
MKVRCARSGRPTEQAGPPRRRGAVRRRLSVTGARCGRAASDVVRWISRRRAVAADQFLRGACYGAGTAVVGLLAVWAQTR